MKANSSPIACECKPSFGLDPFFHLLPLSYRARGSVIQPGMSLLETLADEVQEIPAAAVQVQQRAMGESQQYAPAEIRLVDVELRHELPDLPGMCLPVQTHDNKARCRGTIV
jgi:hypothetical protein